MHSRLLAIGVDYLIRRVFRFLVASCVLMSRCVCACDRTDPRLTSNRTSLLAVAPSGASHCARVSAAAAVSAVMNLTVLCDSRCVQYIDYDFIQWTTYPSRPATGLRGRRGRWSVVAFYNVTIPDRTVVLLPRVTEWTSSARQSGIYTGRREILLTPF